MATLTHKQERMLLKYFAPSIRNHPDWPVIISEGDSWFSFPVHKNTIDFLDDIAKRKISLLRLEKSGDEALRIIGGKQKDKLRTYLTRYPVNALLFSGGGNEVVGDELIEFLNQYESGMEWKDCINEDKVEQQMKSLKDAYLGLIALRDECRPECRIYVHGYDYAIPSGKYATMWGIKRGPWMKPHLEARGIMGAADQKKIIRWLINRFNEMLAEFVEPQPNVVFVRTRRTLTSAEWNDELHPSRKGFQKVAKKFRARLAKQFPDTF